MPELTAEIVSIGTELLLGQIADTDAQHLGRLLPEFGIVHRHRQTVGDNLGRLTQALKLALSRSDIVFTIGGLGPTDDDLTREGIGAALEEELIVDQGYLDRLRRMFVQRSIPWVESQVKQAMKPACARFIENPNGSAPGLICEKDGKVVIALPGPRGEFVPIADGPVSEYLRSVSLGFVIHSRILRVVDMGESVVEDKLRHLMASANPTVAPYAHPGEVHLRLTARAGSLREADELIDPLEASVREALGNVVYGVGENTLEQTVLELLSARGETVAVAESITGGGLGERFTAVAGSGDAFLGGVISYQIEVKKKLLGVEAALLEDEAIGPVSSQVAQQMAAGVRALLGSTYGVSLTGNAGPSTDKGDKPVGLVYVAVAGPDGVTVEEHKFRGQREFIRRRSSQAALSLLRREVLKC